MTLEREAAYLGTGHLRLIFRDLDAPPHERYLQLDLYVDAYWGCRGGKLRRSGDSSMQRVYYAYREVRDNHFKGRMSHDGQLWWWGQVITDPVGFLTGLML